jgi:hypothetical protein
MKTTVAYRFAAGASAAVVLLALSACSTAEVKDTWTSPDVSKITFKNVMVIAATSNDANRRAAENAMVAALPEVRAVSSYTVIPNASDLKDTGKALKTMSAAGMDGVVVMRLISDKREVPNRDSDPGVHASTVLYDGVWGAYDEKNSFDAGSQVLAETKRILMIDTHLYELPSGKLIWKGSTESTSPSSVEQLVGDIVKVLRKKMVEDKLIPASAK